MLMVCQPTGLNAGSYQCTGPSSPLSGGRNASSARLSRAALRLSRFTRAVSLLRLMLRTMSGKAASPSSLVHDSMGVPPTLALISPIGTPYFSYNFFAKEYETTEKRRIFPRVAVIQLPDGRSATGPAKAD